MRRVVRVKGWAWLVAAIWVCAVTMPAGAQNAAQKAAPPGALAGFDDEVARAVKDWNAVGLAIAVVHNGEIVFEKGYGVRTLGGSDAVDARTLFAAGSTTKAMTAAAIGMLVDEGKLAWDDPVTKHLPWFALKDPYMTREIRVRDLLTHRAGVPNTDQLWYEQPFSAREVIERVRHADLETSPRTHFTYQNVMYATAGEVVAAVSGMPWSDFVTRRIFQPLGMTGTIATAATLPRQPNVAEPHYVIDGTTEVIRNASVDSVAPAGSVWSSAHDMALWLRMLLAGGQANGTRLLSEKTMRELFTPQTMVGPDAFYPTMRLTRPHWTTYGLGWFQHDYAGEQVDFHTGSIDGMVAIAGLIREKGIGVYVLANVDHVELRHALLYRVFDRLLGRPARDWSGDIRALYDGLAKEGAALAAKRKAARVTGTTPSLDLARYAGTYTSPLSGTVTIAERAGRLHATYGAGFVGPLDHWHYDTFQATWDARWRGTSLVTFQLDAAGAVASVTLPQGTFTRQAK